MGNFFQVDVNDVQHQISQLPWIYSVSVRKKWPNELKIYVVDQLPVAQWNGDFLINNEGKAFQAHADEEEAPEHQEQASRQPDEAKQWFAEARCHQEQAHDRI